MFSVNTYIFKKNIKFPLIFLLKLTIMFKVAGNFIGKNNKYRINSTFITFRIIV